MTHSHSNFLSPCRRQVGPSSCLTVLNLALDPRCIFSSLAMPTHRTRLALARSSIPRGSTAWDFAFLVFLGWLATTFVILHHFPL